MPDVVSRAVAINPGAGGSNLLPWVKKFNKKVGADPNSRVLIQDGSFISRSQKGIADVLLADTGAWFYKEHGVTAFQCPECETPYAAAVIEEKGGWYAESQFQLDLSRELLPEHQRLLQAKEDASAKVRQIELKSIALLRKIESQKNWTKLEILRNNCRH